LGAAAPSIFPPPIPASPIPASLQKKEKKVLVYEIVEGRRERGALKMEYLKTFENC
jgi:hypothetical protein